QEEVLPVLNVFLKNSKTVDLLLASDLVRYVEPMQYDTALLTEDHYRQSGCSPNLPDLALTPGLHYGVITPFSKASWNYPDHGILDAWRFVSGKGIKVFLIDTGVSYSQENLGSAFNQGFSGARTLERIVTLPRQRFLGVINVGPVETPEDRCGHGTAMAGVLAAPRGTDGNVAGIAYNVNLITCRASSDVFIDEAREVKGVSDAFTRAAQLADVRIISMSMGRITVSSQIRDAIQYAHAKGKMIFCAAGTSFSFTAGWAGVIFPASLPEVQAVTGVQQQSNFTACENCHSGPEVDFVVVMERANDHKTPLTVSDRGDDPSTIGGSSVATASMAGMAALVWSRYPSASRDQILTMLERHSSYYPLFDEMRGVALRTSKFNDTVNTSTITSAQHTNVSNNVISLPENVVGDSIFSLSPSTTSSMRQTSSKQVTFKQNIGERGKTKYYYISFYARARGNAAVSETRNSTGQVTTPARLADKDT
ncbi:MAG: hypothetical protein EB025_07740, partial [Chitinophagaceae bacterium]|nr:hypothetical protein [Chitinophagaceae bacterium]